MFTDPIKNLKAFDLFEDMIVADLGAGTGFYSIAAGHMVPRGKVYAVEIQKDFLNTVRNKAKQENLKNVEVIWGNIERIGGTKIGNHIVDRVVASNVLSQIEDKGKFISEAKRILKKGGMLLLIDHGDEPSLISSKRRELTPKAKIREMFEAEGFVFVRDIVAGTHHYGMIFSKL